MRWVFRLYDNDKHALIETDDDGSNPRVIDGDPQERSKVKRVPAFIEISCDGRPDVIRQVQEAFQDFQQRLGKRLAGQKE